MDMDIPEPDELEWLESNSGFPEEDLDLDPVDLYPPEFEEEEDDQQQQRPQPQSPPKSPQRADPQLNGHKRLRTDGPDAADDDNPLPSEEKRSRTGDGAAEDCDKDWLQYSPPPLPVENVDVVEEKIVSRYASEIDGDFFPVTAPSGGERVYSKICMFEEEKRLMKLEMRGQSNGLILEPINALLQKVEQEAFTKALQASTGAHSDAVLPEEPAMHKQLWVDKYAPNSFTDLLSDEQTNREVLLWLKQWDSCVFGSEIRSTSEDVFSALRRHSSISQHQKVSDTNFARKSTGFRQRRNETCRDSDGLGSENSSTKDIHDFSNKKSRLTGPPEQKILLLCGPPGLGKTTLAHVAAKHCGYRVVEVNASDDRSASTIESKILDVVQMNSVTADSRPKCLVIDEIDGALGDGKGAVEIILKMVSADRKSDGKENAAREELSGRKSSKKGHKAASLSRPVICICNDLYAPALRPLRQVAKVHIFVQPTVSRVVSRIKYICNKEGMKTNSTALTALAEYTGCDIRSCLNTLQFLDKKKEILNVSEISSQVVGRKDMSRSVFDLWKEIFQKRKVKRERKSNNNSSSMSNDFEILYSLIANRGDYDLIFNGIHENMLQLNYHDPMMQKTVRCLNGLGISDLMHQYIMRTQQMSLLVYQPPIVIMVHRLVAQVQRPNIEWPKSNQRYRTMLMDRMENLRSWHYKVLPHIGRHLSTKSFVEDSVSPLLHILSPPALRPAALHLLSDKEKGEFSQLVSIMVSYSVTYKNMKLDPLPGNPRHGAALEASTMCFDPPISEFINFKGYNSGHHVLALAMKQVLVHEVEKKKILLVGMGKSQHLPYGQNKVNQNMIGEVQLEPKSAQSCKNDHAAVCTRTKEKSIKISNPSSSTIPSKVTANVKLQASGDVKPKKPSSGAFNFFDRWKLGSKGSQGTDTAKLKSVTLERDSRPLLFKFNEGFTNAVKRPVRMREFLQ